MSDVSRISVQWRWTSGLICKQFQTCRHHRIRWSPSAVLIVCVLQERPLSPALTRTTFTLCASHMSENCPPLPSAGQQLDRRLANVWASQLVRHAICQINNSYEQTTRGLSDQELEELEKLTAAERHYLFHRWRDVFTTSFQKKQFVCVFAQVNIFWSLFE